jgi:hypothetical protein
MVELFQGKGLYIQHERMTASKYMSPVDRDPLVHQIEERIVFWLNIGRVSAQ